MTGKVVQQPKKHSCDPGWTRYQIDDPFLLSLGVGSVGLKPPEQVDAGTIWECECGKTWVAHYPYPNILSPDYRPEGRFERWRRERKS